jgi:ribosomal protein S18 acetylase RimI-like enzyme
VPASEAKVRIVRGGAERIEDVAPLFAALHEHHAALVPELVGLPARSADAAWRLRRERYVRWLAEPGAFVLVAERDGRAVGYALVVVVDGYDGWASGAQLGEVRDLAVLPELRGRGVGGALMDAVERELANAGIRECRLMVLAGNEDAERFYRRRGMAPVTQVLVGRIAR